jgi:hypothetical protein
MVGMDAKVRKSVPLTAEDREHLERLRTPGSAERAALGRVCGIVLDGNVSEAEALHALLVAGRAAVTEQVMLSGYAALAEAEDDEDRAARRAMRARSAGLKD